jgi:hypothetical protein
MIILKEKKLGLQESSDEQAVFRAWDTFENTLDRYVSHSVQDETPPSKALKTAVAIVLGSLDSWQMLKPVIDDLSAHYEISKILKASYNSVMRNVR